MVARSIYLRVKELLRAQHAPIETGLHRHSGIALKLRADVLDSTTRLNTRLQYLQAWASIHGHPQADIEKAGDSLRNMYYDALNELPYLTGGKSGKEVAQDDRMAAVKRWQAHRDAILKPNSKPMVVEEAPKVANKHRQIPV